MSTTTFFCGEIYYSGKKTFCFLTPVNHVPSSHCNTVKVLKMPTYEIC